MDESVPSIIAGEPLEVLEDAFDRMQLAMEPCGCIKATATLPHHLSHAVERAIAAIEIEMVEQGIEPWSSPDHDPFGELMFRVITARIE